MYLKNVFTFWFRGDEELWRFLSKGGKKRFNKMVQQEDIKLTGKNKREVHWHVRNGFRIDEDWYRDGGGVDAAQPCKVCLCTPPIIQDNNQHGGDDDCDGLVVVKRRKTEFGWDNLEMLGCTVSRADQKKDTYKASAKFMQEFVLAKDKPSVDEQLRALVSAFDSLDCTKAKTLDTKTL